MTGLSTTIFWSIVVILSVTSMLLSYSLIRFQRKATIDTKADNPVLGLVWTLVPVGILIVLLVLTFQSIFGAKP